MPATRDQNAISAGSPTSPSLPTHLARQVPSDRHDCVAVVPLDWQGPRRDSVEVLHTAILNIDNRMTVERNIFLERFGIKREDGDESWLGRLTTNMQRANDYHRRRVSEELRGLAQRARDLDVFCTLRQTFSSVTTSANDIRNKLSGMVQLYQKHRYRIPRAQREHLRLQFDYVRHVISACVTREREARSSARNMQPNLAVLILPQVEFEAFVDSLPPYSTNTAIENRLVDLVNALRKTVSECSTIRRTVAGRLLQTANAQHLDELATAHDTDVLTADYAGLRRKMQSHAALQSNVLAEIQLEQDAACGLPLVLRTAAGNFPVGDLIDALPAYSLLQEELGTIRAQQQELRESLDQASRELIDAVCPLPAAQISI